MKSTLMAVLVITTCNDHTHAQTTPAHTSGYVKYQLPTPGRSIEKSVVRTVATSDGVVTMNKLVNDIFVYSSMTDGAAATDQLAAELLRSLEAYEALSFANPTYTYPDIFEQATVYCDRLTPKPRPHHSKRTGCLPN